MKKLFEGIYKELKKNIKSYISLSTKHYNLSRFSFYVYLDSEEKGVFDPERLIMDGEEWGNRTKIPLKTYSPLLFSDPEGKLCKIEVLDLFTPTEFRVIFPHQQLFSQSKEEWVEFAIKEMGKEIDRLCGKWMKKGCSPQGLSLCYKFPVNRPFCTISIDILDDIVSLICFPNEGKGQLFEPDSLFLYQLIPTEDPNSSLEDLKTYSPILQARIKQLGEKFTNPIDQGAVLTSLKIVDNPAVKGNYIPKFISNPY